MNQIDRIEAKLDKLCREYSVGECPDCEKDTVVLEVPKEDPTVGIMELATKTDLQEFEIGIRCMKCGWWRTFDVVEQ